MFAAVIGLGISAVAGVVGAVFWFIARRRGRGPLPAFIILSLLIPVLMGGLVYLFATSHQYASGAPTGEDYEMWLSVAFLSGLLPGSGLFLGGTGIFIYSFFAKDPRRVDGDLRSE